MKVISIVLGLLVLPIMLYNEKSIQIQGVVINATTNEPLEDSHVYVKGTHIGAITDENGMFSLEVPLIYQNRPLIVSYVGFSNFEKEVSKLEHHKIRIDMYPGIVSLDEIVIMPGKALLVDQAIDQVMEEYDDQEEMLTDFYQALLVIDEDCQVWDKVHESIHRDHE